MKIRNYVTLILIFILIPLNLLIISHEVSAEEVPTEIIKWPLSTAPASTTPNKEFTIILNAPKTAKISSIILKGLYGSYKAEIVDLKLINKLWKITIKTPRSIPQGLYDLIISYNGNTVVQPRSVWVHEPVLKEVVIAHLSDVHYSLNPDNLKHAIEELNFLGVTLAILTGDNVDVGGNLREIKGFYQALQSARFPTYVLPGNHDHAGKGMPNYMKYIGPPNYTVDLGFAVLITLDSGAGGYVPMLQITWAENVLKKTPPNKFKIVATHYPIFQSTTNKTGSWENLEELTRYMYSAWKNHMEESKAYIRMIQENNVELILSGHIHRDEVFILNDRHYFVVTTTLGGPKPKSMPNGYRLIKIKLRGGKYVIKDLTVLDNPITLRPHSIAVEKLIVRYGPVNDGSSTSVTAILRNSWDIEVSGTIIMLLSAEHSPSEYKFFNIRGLKFTINSTESYHIFKSIITLRPGEERRLTIALESDGQPPTLEELEIKVITAGALAGIKVKLKVLDKGWGVENVTLAYSKGPSEKWDMILLEKTNKEIFSGTIKGLKLGDNVYLRIKAFDFALNIAETPTYLVKIEKKPIITTLTPTTTTTTTTVTPTTTTIPTTPTTITPTITTPTTTIKTTKTPQTTPIITPKADVWVVYVAVAAALIVIITAVIAKRKIK